MKKILLSVSCLLAAVVVNSQSPAFEWAKNMGGYYGYAAGIDVTTDASGNVYTTGYFQGRVDFDPGANIFYLTAAGSDIFITKTGAAGNFIWAKQMGGTSNNQSNSIALDAIDNIYVTGYFNGTVDFDPGATTYNLTSEGASDIFVAKLNSSGNFNWAVKFGAAYGDIGAAIAVDGPGNVYTTGTFMGNVDFDPGAGNYFINVNIGNTNNTFISKLNSSGNFIWAKNFGGGENSATSIALDAAGNIYTTGRFYFTNDFDPGAGIFNLTAASGSSDIFIASLNSLGNFNWAKSLTGTGAKFAYST
ncbi:MAG: hypothetical protein ABIT08_05340 [Bacteroidia bacterium]